MSAYINYKSHVSIKLCIKFWKQHSPLMSLFKMYKITIYTIELFTAQFLVEHFTSINPFF